MQMVKKIFLVLFVVWFAFTVFMPKRNLYYQAERMLASEGIKINEKMIREGFFTFSIDDAVIYVEGIDLIHVESAQVTSLLFYTHVTVKNVQMDKSLASIVPTSLRNVTLSHTLFSPKQITVSGEGEFGIFHGTVDLVSHRIHLDFPETDKLGMLKRQLKKGEKGFYYEKSF